MKLLREFENEMLVCTMCGFCRPVCPTLEKRGWESYAPRGLVNIGYGLLKGKLRPSKALVDSAYSCTTCGRCVVKCPPGIKVRDIALAVRSTLFQSSATPASIRSLLTKLAKTGNIYGKENKRTPEKDSDLIFFPGCNIKHKHPEIITSSLRLLNEVGTQAGLWNGTDCCGAPFMLAGALDQFQALARENFEKIKSSRTIFSCPIGFQTVKVSYPTLLKGRAPDTSHITEILSSRIESLHFEETRETVTYHDPCYLARMMKVTEPPRKLLNSIPGIRFVEMADARENTRCCGSGAGITETYSKELSREMAAERIKQAHQVNADRIVTSCPYCLDQLSAVSNGLPVDDITVFLASRLRPS